MSDIYLFILPSINSLMDLAKARRILKGKKSSLSRKYSIKKIGIFGSTARGESRRDSDVDILVEFKTSPGYAFAALESELESFLGGKVDLVSKKALKPSLKDSILSEVIYV